MIDLSQYPKYQRDIQGKHTNIYPIVRIDRVINISTIKEFISNVQYFDYGLSISNIKESLNIKDRKFNIFNVTINLNNYAEDNTRLSDFIFDYINKDVEILYKSQSCDNINDCLPVYKGVLKDVKYNEKTVTLTLEDLTEKTLHKDVPIANLGYSENIYSDKYKNKPIPITYGEVDKAPAVLYRNGNNAEGRIHVISDNVFGINNDSITIKGFSIDQESPESNLNGNIESPLYIHKDNYFNVLEETRDSTLTISGFNEKRQYSTALDNNSLYIDKLFYLNAPLNAVANNELECVRVAFPNDARLLKSDDELNTGSEGEVITVVDSTVKSIEACYDNPDTQGNLILDENYLNTECQIPNNEINLSNTDDVENLIVHEFTPHRNGDWRRNALYYPNQHDGLRMFHVVAWCWSAAAVRPVNFIELPCADAIKEKVETHLSNNNIDITLSSGRSHFFRPQTRLEGLRQQWESFNNRILEGEGQDVIDYDFDAMTGTSYPASVFKFVSDTGQAVYVSQWDSISMVDDSWLGDDVFLNIFPDTSEYPSLFEMNECAVYDPIAKVYEDTSDNLVYRMKYRSYWNGIPIDNINQNSTGSTCIVDEDWMSNADWGFEENTKAKHMCMNNEHSWFMYFTDEIPTGFVINELVTDDVRVTHSGLNNNIKAHTFIPCQHYQRDFNSSQDAYHAGDRFHHDYEIPNSPDSVALDAGSGASAGSILMLTLPMGDLSASDSVECETFAHGKVNCLLNPTGSSFPNTNSTNIFKVLMSSSEDEEGMVGFSTGEFGAAELIVKEGGDFLNTANNELSWSSVAESNDNQFSEGQHIIQNWETPDKFNSISLSYSLAGSNEKFVEFQTNISTLGIMQFISFENALNDNIYLDTAGRSNEIELTGILKENENYATLYTDDAVDFDETTGVISGNTEPILIENPADIMYHFVERELGYKEITNRDSWRKARENNGLFDLAFSVNKEINSKKLFEEMSKNCNIIPRFTQDGEFGFTSINNTYSSSDAVINSNDVVSFDISHTSVNDIKTLVNVKYKKDYEEDEYTKETGYCDGYDFFGNGDDGYVGGYSYDYYGLERDDNILTFESDYIRTKAAAEFLRDFIYLYNCNRHAIVKFSMPMKYSYLELGDVIEFDSIVNNIKSFGEDYTIENKRNGQTIYPYFIITSITKTPKQIKIEATQLHRLDKDVENPFNVALGSLTRTNFINSNDFNILYDIIHDENKNLYLTKRQKNAGDMTGNKILSASDLLALSSITGDIYIIPQSEEDETEESVNDELADILMGDLNNDGEINVVDVVQAVNYILGTNIDNIEAADLNQDGVVNVVDIVQLVNQILGGNE